MLKHLYIKNFALIDELDIDLYQGFSVITGETGAGKSIILGAIGLLLGQRADTKVMRPEADRCVIEAHFDLTRYDMQAFFADNDIDYDPNDCIVRRELTSAGKSRAFINDTPVQLSMLKELGERLVDVHSQHQNLLLNKQDFQLSVVDIIADDAKALSQYRRTFRQYQTVRKELTLMQETIEQNRQNIDFLKFQCQELSDANLVAEELEELERKSETMSHAEEIKGALFETDKALSAEETGVTGSIRTAIHALKSIERVFPDVSELILRLDSSYIELEDIAQDITCRLESVDFDPAELDIVNARLDRLYDLEKKYRVETIDALIQKRDELNKQFNSIENGDEALAILRHQVEQWQIQVEKEAAVLTKLREGAARQIEKEIQTRLISLGMPNVRFAITIATTEPGIDGKDKVAFLFSANTSTPLQPVSQVASGGEIARVMLALKAMISGAVKLPTIIFDEIDTGVSGKMAEKMAEIMQEMGRHGRQVISITHLPQIAALGTTHYRVEKEETSEGTTSRMTELSPDERITEIAQMLSGSNVSEAARQNARQLLHL